jgi:hypothetical protein
VEEGRPEAEAKIAILFSEEDAKPQLIWIADQRPVSTTRRSRSDGKLYQYLQLGDTDLVYELRTIPAPKDRFTIDHTLGLCYKQNFEEDPYSADTISLYDFTDGDIKRAWKGPVLLVSQNDPTSPAALRDVILSDLLVLRDFLKDDGDGLEELLASDKLRAVELCLPVLWDKMLLESMSNAEFI